MGVKPNFDLRAIDQMLNGFQQAVQENAIRILSFVGEKCVNEAKAAGAYNDRTGNLRASSGYIVVDKGRIFENGFNRHFTKRKKDGSADMRYKVSRKEMTEGENGGYELASKLAAQNPQGSALIVVAGMNYAAYVEARGINVLTSAELLAEREVPNLLRQLSR